MTALFIILTALISVALIFIILVQNPKGGGISSAFGGSQAANQLMGAANATDVLEKITWALAGALLVLCLAVGIWAKGSSTTNGLNIDTTTTGAGTTTQPVNNGQPAPTDNGATSPTN